MIARYVLYLSHVWRLYRQTNTQWMLISTWTRYPLSIQIIIIVTKKFQYSKYTCMCVLLMVLYSLIKKSSKKTHVKSPEEKKVNINNHHCQIAKGLNKLQTVEWKWIDIVSTITLHFCYPIRIVVYTHDAAFQFQQIDPLKNMSSNGSSTSTSNKWNRYKQTEQHEIDNLISILCVRECLLAQRHASKSKWAWGEREKTIRKQQINNISSSSSSSYSNK